MKLIPLSTTGKNKGKHFAKVDDADYEALSKHKWAVKAMKRAGRVYLYAYRGVRLSKTKVQYFLMHREILGITDSAIQGDHKDHDTLNNQRSNLRISTPQQNVRNGSAKTKASSKYKGVTYIKKWGNWQARIGINGKQKSLGYYADEKEAAIAYDEAAKQYYGEFANLNFKP